MVVPPGLDVPPWAPGPPVPPLVPGPPGPPLPPGLPVPSLPPELPVLAGFDVDPVVSNPPLLTELAFIPWLDVTPTPVDLPPGPVAVVTIVSVVISGAEVIMSEGPVVVPVWTNLT